MTVHVQLHDRLDYQSVPPLLAELQAIDDPEIIIDAGQVRHLGAMSFQVLLSAIKTRHEAGKSTRLINASENCVDLLSLFGFTPENLTQPESWT
jgi:anti-anti-sigma regulatory factor